MRIQTVYHCLLRTLLLFEFVSPLFGLAKGIVGKVGSTSTSKSTSTTTRSLSAKLQRCFTPQSILENVGRHISADTDPHGLLSSLVLVRLSKQLISIGNMPSQQQEASSPTESLPLRYLTPAIRTLSSSNWSDSPKSLDAAVEGTKAASTLLRCLPNVGSSCLEPLLERWTHESDKVSSSDQLQPHQLSGLKWSFDCFKVIDPTCTLPSSIEDSYDRLNLPFRIRPNFLKSVDCLSLETLIDQVDFKVDDIRTNSNHVVKERRKTAWEGDDSVGPFFYSGKSMDRRRWSPLVLDVRDRLHLTTGQYYDCCLLNLYPDGDSGMRYHIDPDQGTLWDFETAVVSIGATRKFAFREISTDDDDNTKQTQQPHVFVLMHGDVTEMFSNCQTKFQHTVKTSETGNDVSPRASLVFKKSLAF